MTHGRTALTWMLGLAFAMPRVSFRLKVLLVLGVLAGWSLLSYAAFLAGVRVAWFVLITIAYFIRRALRPGGPSVRTTTAV